MDLRTGKLVPGNVGDEDNGFEEVVGSLYQRGEQV